MLHALRPVFLLYLLFFFQVTEAQVCVADYFVETFHTPTVQTVTGSIALANNELLSSGFVKRPNSLHTHGWLAKYSAQGTVLWSRRYLPSLYNSIEFNAVIQSADGSFFAVGTTGDKDEVVGGFAQGFGFIMKLDRNGAPLWSKLFTKESLHEGGSEITGITAVAGGDLILALHYSLNLQRIGQTILQRIDGDGVIKWTSSFQSATYSTLGKPLKYGHSLYRYFNHQNSIVIPLRGGNMLLVKALNFSDAENPAGSKGYYALCFDPTSGAKAWERHYTYTEQNQGKRPFADVKNVTHLPDGTISIISSYGDAESLLSPFNKQGLNLTIDASGKLLNARGYHLGTEPLYVTAGVTLNNDGDQALLLDNGNHPFLLQLNREGGVAWAKGYEKMLRSQETTTLLATANGFYFYSFIHDGGPKDFTLVKTDREGNNECMQTPLSVTVTDLTGEFREKAIAFELNPRKAVWIDGGEISTSDYGLIGSNICRKACCSDVKTETTALDLCNKSSYTLPDGYVVKENGTYPIILKTSKGCDSIVTYNLAFSTKPQLSLGRDLCFLGRDSLILKTAEGYGSYYWNGIPSESNQFTVKRQGLYTVKVTNSCGSATDSVRVFDDCNFRIDIPNAFTPNGDGKNDRFGVPPSNHNILLHLAIYNRWGDQVFSSNNRNAAWDGTVRGIPQPGGVYVYRLSMKGLSGDKFEKTGSFILIR